MEFMLFVGDDFDRLYNCSFYNYTDISISERRSIPLGLGQILFGGIALVLYILCMFSLLKHRQNACYKFLFGLGVVNIPELFIVGPLSGYFRVTGAVYCTYPTTMYIAGCIMIGAVVGQLCTDLLLAVHQSLLKHPKIVQRLFPEQSQWAWCWMVIPFTLQFLFTMFGTPAIFCAIKGQWMWNPHQGYYNEMFEEYANGVSMMLYAVSKFATLVPLVLMVVFGCTKCANHQLFTPITSSILTQTATVCLIQCIDCTLLIFVMYSDDANSFVSFLQHFLSLLRCGIPPIISLWFIQEIRNDVKSFPKIAIQIIQNKKHV